MIVNINQETSMSTREKSQPVTRDDLGSMRAAWPVFTLALEDSAFIPPRRYRCDSVTRSLAH